MPSRLDRARRRIVAFGDRRPVSPRAHAIAAWSALFFFTIIVITGAGVRLTGSGLGCHDWPRCSDQSLTPTTGHGFIEFGNRLVTTPVSIAAIACLVMAVMRRPYRRDLTLLGSGLVLGVFAQAVLGGITVLTDLNAVVVMAHFLLSMATLVVAVGLVWRVQRERRGERERPQRDARLVWAIRGLVVFGAVVVFVGTAVTAAGPHAGGSGTGDDVRRLTIFGYDTFRHVIATHARVAGVFGGLAVVLWVLARRSGASRDLMLPLTAVCVAVGIAGLIGNLQYHQFDYPAGLVWAHVAVATMLWNALCWAFFAAGRPVRAPRPAGDDPGIATPDDAQRTREPTTA